MNSRNRISPGLRAPSLLFFALLLLAAIVPVSIAADDGGSGNVLAVEPEPQATPHFTIAVKPARLTLQPGQSGSTQVVTKAKGGYNNQLQLSVSNVPAGVSVSLDPSLIPAPGTGTSELSVTVSNSVPKGTYHLIVSATDGTTTLSAKLNLKVTAAVQGPGAHFQGCWYKTGGHRYQGVNISVDNPGTYPFNAVLYHGATCDPNEFADQIGFGTPIDFGGFGYIFWFTDFADQTNTSALWYVGNESSQCVNYAVAPDC